MARSQCWLSVEEYQDCAALEHFKDLDAHSSFLRNQIKLEGVLVLLIYKVSYSIVGFKHCRLPILKRNHSWITHD